MDEEELKQIEEGCQRFKSVIKTVFYLAVMLFAAYLAWLS